jgi:hypothetical protein
MDRFIVRRPKPELKPEPVEEDTKCEMSGTTMESVDTSLCASAGSRPTPDDDEDDTAGAESCFATSLVPMAEAPHLKSPVFLTDHKEIDGKIFIKMTKVDSKIARLLVGESVRGVRPLAKTNIIESLTELRNDNFLLFLGSAGGDMENEPKHEDLGIDLATEHRQVAKRRRASPRPVLQQTTVVSAPSVLGVEGIDVCVALDGPGKPLWVEFSAANLNYVSSVCRAQLKSGDIKRSPNHKQSDGGEEQHDGVGVYWLESRLQWRVNWKGGDGKRHCEAVRLEDGTTRADLHFEASKADARATAVGLLQTRVSACD